MLVIKNNSTQSRGSKRNWNHEKHFRRSFKNWEPRWDIRHNCWYWGKYQRYRKGSVNDQPTNINDYLIVKCHHKNAEDSPSVDYLYKGKNRSIRFI